MDTTRAIGNYLTLTAPGGSEVYRFQNFYIQADSVWKGQNYSFLPFGFSGVTVDLQGANVEAALVFPNNELSRDWATKIVEQAWIVHCQVLIVDPEGSPISALHGYVGQVTGAGWDETALNLKTSSVLDAVGSDVPNRKLSRALVGALPVTDAIRL